MRAGRHQYEQDGKHGSIAPLPKMHKGLPACSTPTDACTPGSLMCQPGQQKARPLRHATQAAQGHPTIAKKRTNEAHRRHQQTEKRGGCYIHEAQFTGLYCPRSAGDKRAPGCPLQSSLQRAPVMGPLTQANGRQGLLVAPGEGQRAGHACTLAGAPRAQGPVGSGPRPDEAGAQPQCSRRPQPRNPLGRCLGCRRRSPGQQRGSG